MSLEIKQNSFDWKKGFFPFCFFFVNREGHGSENDLDDEDCVLNSRLGHTKHLNYRALQHIRIICSIYLFCGRICLEKIFFRILCFDTNSFNQTNSNRNMWKILENIVYPFSTIRKHRLNSKAEQHKLKEPSVYLNQLQLRQFAVKVKQIDLIEFIYFP